MLCKLEWIEVHVRNHWGGTASLLLSNTFSDRRSSARRAGCYPVVSSNLVSVSLFVCSVHRKESYAGKQLSSPVRSWVQFPNKGHNSKQHSSFVDGSLGF